MTTITTLSHTFYVYVDKDECPAVTPNTNKTSLYPEAPSFRNLKSAEYNARKKLRVFRALLVLVEEVFVDDGDKND